MRPARTGRPAPAGLSCTLPIWEPSLKQPEPHGAAPEAALPLVVVGASAGGVEALSAFFKHLPNSRAAFVVVTHLAPGQKSLLPEILGRCTAMPVAAAEDGQTLEEGRVYVLPPGCILTFADDRLALAPRGEERNVLDVCLTSMAAAVGERAIGVILSGTGSDGALGIKAVRAAGGITLAQGTDGSAPSYPSMPAAAIATGFVDCVLPIEALADRVATFIDTMVAAPGSTAAGDQWEQAKGELCVLLQRRIGHDFAGYKSNTFLRRVERRMHVHHVSDVRDYLGRCKDDPEELDELFHDLLISVTAFFRDVTAFERLAELVTPQLVAGKGAGDTIRVWVPGCATGEEAYSLAILLLERFGRGPSQPRLQIFATDVDERALAVARAGRYPERLLEGVPQERLERFFEKHGSSFVVSKELRDACIFSCHSVVRDPPFSRMDLISCRNLLIYLDADLQNQIIPLFHYALRPSGFLFLGSSEHVSQHANLFAPLDKKHRIFQRRDQPGRPSLFPAYRAAAAIHLPAPAENRAMSRSQDATRRFEAIVLDRYAPAHVIVDASGEVTHYSGRTGKYLEQPAGAPNRNLLAIARKGLRLPLRSALDEVAATKRRTVREGVSVELDGGRQSIDLIVEPLPNGAEPFWLVVFEDIGGVESRKRGAEEAVPSADSADDLYLVEQELRHTREQLHASIEEYQSSVAELKSSNEEMLSVNEELQSSNEELETAKEELQSVNEELHTVNAELSRKIDELDRSNSDIKNLFESTRIATVFLDANLVIRAFTPAAAEIFKVIPGDSGRPLSDIVSFLDYQDLAADVAAVVESEQPLERQLSTHDHAAHYLMRILPYRTTEGGVDGVVVTFVNVSPLIQLGEQQALVAELNHRVKNILAVVASMAVQMARRCNDMGEFTEAFVGRIEGLAKTHEILSLSRWTRVGLRDLLSAELKAFVADADRVVLDGPGVHLKPRAATTLGIIFPRAGDQRPQVRRLRRSRRAACRELGLRGGRRCASPRAAMAGAPGPAGHQAPAQGLRHGAHRTQPAFRVRRQRGSRLCG